MTINQCSLIEESALTLVYNDPLAATLFWTVYAALTALDARLIIESVSGRAARGSSTAQGPAHRPSGLLLLLGAEAAGLLAAVIDRLVLPWRWPLLVLGVAIAWTGLALRLSAKRALGRFFVGAVVLQDGHRVITTGPYATIRHPGYAGAIVSMAGLGIATGNVLSAMLFIVVPISVFVRTIAIEEAALVANLGQPYADYRNGRARLVPNLW